MLPGNGAGLPKPKGGRRVWTLSEVKQVIEYFLNYGHVSGGYRGTARHLRTTVSAVFGPKSGKTELQTAHVKHFVKCHNNGTVEQKYAGPNDSEYYVSLSPESRRAMRNLQRDKRGRRETKTKLVPRKVAGGVKATLPPHCIAAVTVTIKALLDSRATTFSIAILRPVILAVIATCGCAHLLSTDLTASASKKFKCSTTWIYRLLKSLDFRFRKPYGDARKLPDDWQSRLVSVYACVLHILLFPTTSLKHSS